MKKKQKSKLTFYHQLKENKFQTVTKLKQMLHLKYMSINPLHFLKLRISIFIITWPRTLSSGIILKCVSNLMATHWLATVVRVNASPLKMVNKLQLFFYLSISNHKTDTNHPGKHLIQTSTNLALEEVIIQSHVQVVSRFSKMDMLIILLKNNLKMILACNITQLNHSFFLELEVEQTHRFQNHSSCYFNNSNCDLTFDLKGNIKSFYHITSQRFCTILFESLIIRLNFYFSIPILWLRWQSSLEWRSCYYENREQNRCTGWIKTWYPIL